MKTVNISIDVAGFQMEGNVTVSTELASPVEMIPLARGVSDAISSQTCDAIKQAGESVSCKKGCAACCRYHISVSEAEARELFRLVENLPEENRSKIRRRYAEILQYLDKTGLLQQIRNFVSLTADERISLMNEYLGHHIDCPFLDDECCSIHLDRPLMCREHLVISPAENCSQPTADNIRRVNLPLWTHNAFARMQVPESEQYMERWVPLILALEWAELNPEPAPSQSGESLMSEFFNHLINTRDLFGDEQISE